MQTSESIIMYEIIELNNKYKDFLSSIKLQIEKIRSKIENNSNTFFIENGDISDQLHELYDFNKIDLLVTHIENSSKNIEQTLLQCCSQHNFIEDHIDIDCDKYMKISYCSHCNISKT